MNLAHCLILRAAEGSESSKPGLWLETIWENLVFLNRCRKLAKRWFGLSIQTSEGRIWPVTCRLIILCHKNQKNSVIELLFWGGKQATWIWGIRCMPVSIFACFLLKKEYSANNKVVKNKLWFLQFSFTVPILRYQKMLETLWKWPQLFIFTYY